MAKKLAYKRLIYASAGASASAVLLFFILGIINVVSTLCSVLVCVSSALVGAGLCVLFYFLNKKAIKKEKEEKLRQELIARNLRLKALYDALKIPYQYAEDGHIKDIFELLKIKPMFDENGKRTPLVYELLKILPSFDKNGNERPTVFAIKNRVKKVAKGIISPIVLTYKPKTKVVEEAQKQEGKKEEKSPKKDVKAQAKEAAKKPAAKAKSGGENKGQQGLVIKVKPKAVSAAKLEVNTLDRSSGAGFKAYKPSKDPSVSKVLGSGEFTSASSQPESISSINSQSSNSGENHLTTDFEDNFGDKNLDTTKMSYIFDEGEMEK